MSKSAGIVGKGTILGYKTVATASTYTAMLEVTSVNQPPQTVEEVDFTHYTSDDGFKEVKPGWKSSGDVSVEGNYLSARNTTLATLVGVETDWEVLLTDGGKWHFNGFIKSWDGDMPNDGKISTKFAIRVNGKPTWVPPT
jgi:hypothetical protein